MLSLDSEARFSRTTRRYVSPMREFQLERLHGTPDEEQGNHGLSWETVPHSISKAGGEG
jgi:hypothetical protein